MKYSYFLVVMLALWLLGCDQLIEDPDKVRVGMTIEIEHLTKSIWKVDYINKDIAGAMDQFNNVFLEFNQDNTLNLINGQRELFIGQWALSASKDLLVIRSDGKIPAPFNEIENEWIISDSTPGKLIIQERDPSGRESFQFTASTIEEIPRVCEDLTHILVGKEWFVDYLMLANNDITEEMKDYRIVFDDDLNLTVFHNGQSFTGFWNAGISCDKFLMNFKENSSQIKLTGSWFLTHISENTIKLSIGNGNARWELILVSDEESEMDYCLETGTNLSRASWHIDKFMVGNENYMITNSSMLAHFEENGQWKIIKGDNEFEGSWNFDQNCEIITLDIAGDDVINQLRGDWYLLILSSTTMKIVMENENLKKEVIFKRASPDDEEPADECVTIRNILEKNQSWKIAYYQRNDDSPSNDYENVWVIFKNDQQLYFIIGNDKIEGTWKLKEGCQVLEITTEKDFDLIDRLALAWYIVEYTEEKIILVHEKEDERIEIKLII